MKSHAFDPLSFLAGLTFTGIGIAAAAGGLDDLESLRVGWPLLLVAIGLLLVTSTLRPRQRAGDTAAIVTPAVAETSEPRGEPAFGDEPNPFDPVELDEATPEG